MMIFPFLSFCPTFITWNYSIFQKTFPPLNFNFLLLIAIGTCGFLKNWMCYNPFLVFMHFNAHIVWNLAGESSFTPPPLSFWDSYISFWERPTVWQKMFQNLYFLCLSPGISLSSKRPWSFFTKDDI